MELTFDKAVELLEIADISKIKSDDIPRLEKKAKKRWHPDKVSHLNNPELTQEYTVNFQLVETSCQMITSYLQGKYKAGDAFSFSQSKHAVHEEPEEVIRRNASTIQATLKNLWSLIKEKKYKWAEKEVVLSDGFKLKDLLREDFKEDIAMLSIISLFYGLLFLGVLTWIGSLISAGLGTIIGVILILHALACFLGFAPLSRFWLPPVISNIMIKFINFGLGVYNWAEEQAQTSSNGLPVLLVRIPVLFAKLIKYIILFPFTELTRIIVKDKIVGVVKQKVNYYADAADWYIEELINKSPQQMTAEELFNLSYLYSALGDAKSKF